jgi:hypothetical protein
MTGRDSIVVEAARRFYEKYGFRALVDDQLHLYVSMKTLKKIFSDV